MRLPVKYLAFVLALCLPEASTSFADEASQAASMQAYASALKLKVGELGEAPAAPAYVYHWIELSRLEEMLKERERSGVFPLRNLSYPGLRTLLSISVPELEGKPGTFVWTDSLTGSVGNGSGEVYGKNEALVRFRIRPGVKAAILGTEEYKPVNVPRVGELKKFDMLFHASGVVPEDGSIGLTEWVILKPGAYDEVEIRPSVLKKDLDADFKLLAAAIKSAESEPDQSKSFQELFKRAHSYAVVAADSTLANTQKRILKSWKPNWKKLERLGKQLASPAPEDCGPKFNALKP